MPVGARATVELPSPVPLVRIIHVSGSPAGLSVALKPLLACVEVDRDVPAARVALRALLFR